MSITSQTQKYISEHPSVKDSLRKGIVNYSALAREICTRLQIKNFDAVLVACRRYSGRVRSQPVQEKRITQLIKEARIQLQNKMVIAIIEKPRDFERLYHLQKEIKRDKGDFHLMEGQDVVTVISNAEYESQIRAELRGKLLKFLDDMAQITMVFDEKIETTPGVVSFVYGLLADHGVNVREEMSCWTDLIIMLAEEDAAKAMRVLSLP